MIMSRSFWNVTQFCVILLRFLMDDGCKLVFFPHLLFSGIYLVDEGG